MLTITFVLCAVQALVLASPFPQEEGGTRISLSKRQLLSSGDVANGDVLQRLLDSVEL